MSKAARHLAAILLALHAGMAAAAVPRRVISTNLCTDALVLMLADRAQIAALSPLAGDCRVSMLCTQAAMLPRQAADAETVLGSRPDLLLGGTFGAALAMRLAQRHGIAVLRLPPVSALDEIPAQIRTMASALGQSARGAALAEAFMTRLAALRARAASLTTRPHAAWIEPHGLLSTPGSLNDDLLRAAGFEPLHGPPDLERLILARPDLLVVEPSSGSPSQAQALLDHPALRDAFGGRHRAAIAGNRAICGLPQTLDALETLVAAHERLAQ